MFASIRNFLNRHKRKFLTTGLVVGGGWLLVSYARKLLRDWQEREAMKFLEMTRKKQHFESTERTCNQTILSLSKITCETVLKVLNTEEIVLKLKETPEDKITLWEQLKVMIFTRICVLVYSLCILQVMLRVQLNIIGGYLYRSSIEDQAPAVNGDLQAKYLSLCHHFVSHGVEDLSIQITEKVKRVVEPIPLKKKMSLQDVEQIFWSVQTLICTDDSDPVKQMVSYLFGHEEDLSDATLNTIVKETMDMLESEEVASLTMSCVSRCFSSVMDEISSLFGTKLTSLTKNHLEQGTGDILVNGDARPGTSKDHFVDVNRIEMPFAKILPLINELITKTCNNTDIPNLLIQQLTLHEKVKLLGANIYEVFSSA